MKSYPRPDRAGFTLTELALASAIPGFAVGAPLLTHRWWISEGGFALGTTLLFDTGVYLAVAGSVLTFLAPYLDDRGQPA